MAQEVNIKKQDPQNVSALNLAFLGDSVYELVIRNKILLEFNGSLKKVNEKSSALARATTQSKMILSIMDELTDEELKQYKRGRNTKSVSAPKNCSIVEYRHATGFEALIGYLYLSGEISRLNELIDKGIENIKNEK